MLKDKRTEIPENGGDKKYMCFTGTGAGMSTIPPDYNIFNMINSLFEAFGMQIKIMKTYKQPLEKEIYKYMHVFEFHLQEMKRQNVIEAVPSEYQILPVLIHFVDDINDDELDEIHHEERSVMKSKKYSKKIFELCKREGWK